MMMRPIKRMRWRLLFLLAGLAAAASACSFSFSTSESDSEADAVTTAPEVASESSVTTEPSTTTAPTPAPSATVPEMTGFCGELPLDLLVATFDGAIPEETLATPDEQTCALEVRASGRVLGSFDVQLISDVAPGGFQLAQDTLFENNQLVADLGGEATRTSYLLADEAELITGFLTQLAVLDGDRAWLVRQGSADRPNLTEAQFVELATIVFENGPR